MKTRTLTNRMEKSSSLGFSRHCAERPSSRRASFQQTRWMKQKTGAAIQSRAVPCGLRTPRATPLSACDAQAGPSAG